MDVDGEIGNSAENCDETDYETDEEALGKISRKLSNNFPLLHYRNPKNNFNFVCIVFEIIFCFPVHVTIAGTLQEDLRNLKPSEFSFIDIDREKPLVVIGNQIFSGEYQVQCLCCLINFRTSR